MMPRSSRLREGEELPTELPLAVWTELGNLSILVQRNDGEGINRGACVQVIGEPCRVQRPTVLRSFEQAQQLVLESSIDQRGRFRGIVQLDLRQLLRDVVHVATGTAGILECELTLASRAYQGDVGAATQPRAQHRSVASPIPNGEPPP